jgi:hypothetical protein
MHMAACLVHPIPAQTALQVVLLTVQCCLCLPKQGVSSGSGVILDPDGTILTNAHIVAEALPERQRGQGGAILRPSVVHVALQDGRVFEGQVVSSDRCPLVTPVQSALPLGGAAQRHCHATVALLGSVVCHKKCDACRVGK